MTPVVLRAGPYRCYFYSQEPDEPPHVHVDRDDGRTIITPLAWYPRLLHATPAEWARWEKASAGFGVHWPELDEDLSVRGMLRGAPSAPGTVPDGAVRDRAPIPTASAA